MKLKSIIESILFAIGEPISIKKIAKVVGKEPEEIKKALQVLDKEYRDRGLKMIRKGERVQLVTNPQSSKYIEKLIKDDLSKELSPASLETLAIIAYKGPVSRQEIEEIRGVNCSFILRNLMIRGLVERTDNPKDNRSYLYEVSFDFLKRLGLKGVEELPDYKRLTGDTSR